jgi:hypothetical protein
MTRAILPRIVLASSLLAATAHAQPAAETRGPAFSDRFFYGSSPGELPDSKLAVVGGMYAAAVASSAVGVAFLFGAADERDRARDFKLSQERGFCNELANDPCNQYRRLLDNEVKLRQGALALFGVTGLLAAGGALTAELWRNDNTPSVAAFAGDGFASVLVSGSF